MLGEELHRGVALLARDPVAVAQLDRDREVAAAPAEPFEVVERAGTGLEVRREREHDRAELAELRSGAIDARKRSSAASSAVGKVLHVELA